MVPTPCRCEPCSASTEEAARAKTNGFCRALGFRRLQWPLQSTRLQGAVRVSGGDTSVALQAKPFRDGTNRSRGARAPDTSRRAPVDYGKR